MQYEIYDLGNRQIIENPERESEMQKYIDDLGLAGQKELIVEQSGKIIPFPKMNVTDERVWTMACPEKTTLEKYSAQVIPFEILELIAMVKTKGYFDINEELETEKDKRWDCKIGSIQIWDRPKDQIDPLVVGRIQSGYKNDKESTYLYSESNAFYLLGRWGHELVPFDKIVENAKKNWIDKRSATAKNKILEAEKAISGIEADAIDYFAGEYIRELY